MGRRGRDSAAALVVVLAAAAAAASASSPAEGFQPLSKIAVHRTTVEMQPSAYVRATPSLLGGQVLARFALCFFFVHLPVASFILTCKHFGPLASRD
jgi:hypothetical protein